MSQPLVITISGAMRGHDYYFIQAQGPCGPRTTESGAPLFALPGGGVATEESILDHLQAKRGYRPRARRKE